MSLNSEHKQILAKLEVQLAIRHASIRADPIPLLNTAFHMLARVRKCIDDIDYALSPEVLVDWGNNHKPPIQAPDINGEALIRCNAAKKVIRDYLHGDKPK